MKKILLSCSVLLGLLSAKAQLGANYAHDDFQLDVPYGNTQGGVFWFNDENLIVEGEPSTLYITRTGGGSATVTMEEDIMRNGQIVKTASWDQGKSDENPTGGTYVFGVSWGDSNGEEPGGTPYSIDISANKKMSITVKNDFGVPVHFDFQFQDVNGVKLEVQADTATGSWNEKQKFKCTIPAGETKVCEVDLEGGWTLDYENAPLDDYDGEANPWPCEAGPWGPGYVGCPLIKDNTSFDFTQLTQVIILPNGQCARADNFGAIDTCSFGDKVKLLDFKIGSVPEKAPAPVLVDANTNSGEGRIDLSWTVSGTFDSIRVARSTDPLSGYEFILAESATTTTFSDGRGMTGEERNLEPNTTYYYYIIADNGLYSYSERIEATTLPPADAPVAPTNFTAVEKGSGILLTWKNNAENADEFVVYRKLSTETSYTELTTTTDTSYVDPFGNYVIGKEYMYKVEAKNSGGSSAGVTASVSAVGFGDDIVKLSATIYPNPATSEVNFSEELKDVVIYNSHGAVMYSASKASKVNVSEFSKGLYLIQTAKGSKTFVVE